MDNFLFPLWILTWEHWTKNFHIAWQKSQILAVGTTKYKAWDEKETASDPIHWLKCNLEHES